MGKLFGTDGIRGVANLELTPELALSLGRAIVTMLREGGVQRPAVLVGRDPRWSGELLESALVAGIAAAGGDAVTVGVVPTPAIAFLTDASDVAAGAMISASHNPVGDNGIKVFAGDGFKFSDQAEDRLEELIEHPDLPRPTGTAVGRIVNDPTRTMAYIEHLLGAADRDLGGLKLVVDGANGAASTIAPLVYRRLGAEVFDIHCRPDGANINVGVGSTHPEVVAAAVRERGADVGLAHDGDADRLIAADSEGGEVDGDVTLAILADARKRQNSLPGDRVVTTVMTNLGFKRAMEHLGIRVVETRVGDRYVLEAMREHDAVLGGEQSGHLVQLDHATTGDGILTALKLLGVVRESDTPLRELATIMTRLPQVLVNVPVLDRSGLERSTDVWEAVRREEAVLGHDGRVLVRPSGTEPLVRVMVEAPTQAAAQATAQRIASTVRSALGAR
ncbi:MAG TPA: phosphoglucosamine mutase [Nitriliruptorales bacterium]|nr:phosphoglucosamine mutase [Nitriliruptorales bacterium]